MVKNIHSECRQSSFGIRLRSMLQAFVCCALLIAFSAVGHAQTATGQFNGHVFDENGAVLVGTAVTLSSAQSGLSRTATTNGEGFYLFPLLPPGVYKITAMQDGFQSAVSPELRLDVNQNASQDFRMQVGAISETVNVSASAELLQASSTEMGTVVEERTVNELPLNGRNFTALLTLSPGVNPVNYSQNNTLNASAAPPGLPTATFVFPSVQGQWNRENLYFQDGLSNTAVNRGSYDVPPIVDAIQEFKIQSHNDVAEFGGVLGGVINIVTKSGTNSYHGSAWEYIRNNVFDARNPFTDFNGNTPAPPASFHQNEYGGTIGGPIRIPKVYNGTNKTFFFFAYEGWRYSNAAGLSYVSPTAAELNGDFTNPSILSIDTAGQAVPALLYDPYTTAPTASPGVYTRQLLGGDGRHIPASLIDPGNQAFLKTYSDTPNFTPTTPGGANTILNSVGTNNANQYNGRIDHSFGPNDTVFFRYSLLSQNITNPQTFHLVSFNTTTNKNFGGGYTHVFSPRLILDARVGRSGRFGATSGSAPLGGVPRSGFPGIEPNYGSTSFGYTSSSAAGETGLAQGYKNVGDAGPLSVGGSASDTNYAANITWIRGSHQIRFGFQQLIFGQVSGPIDKNYGTATFSFATPETANPQNTGSTGNSLASALMGLPNNGRFNRPSQSATRFLATAAYIQDSWKVSPNLTLNAGLRWDGQSSPHLLNGTTAAMLDPNTGNWIISGGKLPPPCNPAAGVYAPCIPSADPATNAIIADHVKVADNPNLGPDPNNTNFGPRFGFAYKLDSSTVVRGGYGMIFDTTQGSVQTVADRLNAWPSNLSLPLVFNVIGQPLKTMTGIIPTLSDAKALPAVPTPFQQYGWYYDPHMKSAYSHQFNVDIQRQLTSSLLASVSYVGSVNGRLQMTGLANNSPVPGQADTNRPFPWSGTAIMATDRGISNYNALQAKVEKRLTSGVAFGAGYTWSKSMDNGASGFYGVENGPQSYSAMQNYNDLDANYGISGNSIKHIVYAWGLYELPFGKNKPYLNHGLVSYVAGGWQANANMSAHSGAPLGFPDAGRDPANIGNTSTYNYARADLKVGENPRVAHPTKSMAFNVKAFDHPPVAPYPARYGNSGRGIVNGMLYDNVDFSLLKKLQLGELAALQFRAEFFNVFNIQNYGLPGTTYGASGFGVINGLAAGAKPRQMQFSLRASF